MNKLAGIVKTCLPVLVIISYQISPLLTTNMKPNLLSRSFLLFIPAGYSDASCIDGALSNEVNYINCLVMAKEGDIDAQYNIGVMYQKGIGVSQDYQEALKWHVKAAERKSPHTQYSLGTMYIDGLGVAQDYEAATVWFRKAAEKGYAPAQYSLGAMYCNGQSVFEDRHEALKWIGMAAGQGCKPGMSAVGQFVF